MIRTIIGALVSVALAAADQACSDDLSHPGWKDFKTAHCTAPICQFDFANNGDLATCCPSSCPCYDPSSFTCGPAGTDPAGCPPGTGPPTSDFSESTACILDFTPPPPKPPTKLEFACDGKSKTIELSSDGLTFSIGDSSTCTKIDGSGECISNTLSSMLSSIDDLETEIATLKGYLKGQPFMPTPPPTPSRAPTRSPTDPGCYKIRGKCGPDGCAPIIGQESEVDDYMAHMGMGNDCVYRQDGEEAQDIIDRIPW